MTRDFYIPDSHVQRAFDIMRSMERARTRAAYEAHEKRLKIILAEEQSKSNAKTNAEKEQDAYRSAAYREAVDTLQVLSEARWVEEDRLNAANAVVEAWRTQQSNLRSMGKV
jgi:hypothetical protein